MFADKEFFEKIREDTIRYAIEKEEKRMKRPATDEFKESVAESVTCQKILNYTAVLLAMGLLRHPDINMCWNDIKAPRDRHSRKRSQPSYYGSQFIQSIMTSDEFWAFNGIFHWTGVNKLNVQWFENHLNTLFLWYWVAYQHIIVDKGIIPFLGVMSGRAYIPKKPHDTGIKYYASADEMFYVLYFWLHGDFRTKAQKENNEPNPCSQNPNTVIWCVLNAVRDADEDAIKQRAETATREIVLEIAEEIEEEIGDAMVDEEPMTILMEDTVTEGIKEMGGYMVDNRILVADSYYGSLELARELDAAGWLFILACQANRPAWLFSAKSEEGPALQKRLKKGEWAWVTDQEGKLIAVSFYDSGRCNFLSNYAVCIYSIDFD